MTTSLQITVEIKEVYGKQVVYPVCDAAKAFAAIASTTTLTANAIKGIKALGYAIAIKQAELAL
jgi:hypothetical protein